MSFEEWWKEHYTDKKPWADYATAETIWQAAQAEQATELQRAERRVTDLQTANLNFYEQAKKLRQQVAAKDEALRRIQDMADEEIRQGAQDNSVIWQIEADARAAIERPTANRATPASTAAPVSAE